MGQYDSERTRVTQIHQGKQAEEPARPGEACVVVIYGPELGKRLQLGTAPFTIGRSSKSDLFLDQESVSRNHARVSFDGTQYWIADLQSTNGTFVNDEPARDQRLRDGDQIRVGRSILKFMTGENVEMHYHEEIYRLMTVDGLTQVFNRRYFNEALEREFNRSKRYERALSLIVFDIDHFKRCNDTYGHLAGDNLLRLLVHRREASPAPRGHLRPHRRRGVRHPAAGDRPRGRADDGREGAQDRGGYAAEVREGSDPGHREPGRHPARGERRDARATVQARRRAALRGEAVGAQPRGGVIHGAQGGTPAPCWIQKLICSIWSSVSGLKSLAGGVPGIMGKGISLPVT